MGVGKIFKDEVFTYVDKYSGRTVRQLTDYAGHSNQLYFTNPSWCGDRSFVFTSDRDGHGNLFRYDLDTETIKQLTDLKGATRPSGCYCKTNNAHYFWDEKILYELNMETLKQRKVYEADDGFIPRAEVIMKSDGRYIISSKGDFSITADGKYACCLEFLWDDIKPEKPEIYYSLFRHAELLEKRPLGRLVKIEIATGKLTVLMEDRRYMAHVNTSPSNPDVLMFCHEGPWHLVPQRMWGMNIKTGEVWKIRPQDEDNSAIGHEFWLEDGVRIGYHGRNRVDQGKQFYGSIKWDNTERIEIDFPFQSTHFHSLDLSLITGDGTAVIKNHVYGKYGLPYIMLFKKEGDKFVGPRILSYHRSTFNDQYSHPHPQITPDGKHVIYSSDLTGYANIYMVEIGDFYDLPVLQKVE